jgi:hypothetical protein
LRFTAAAVYDNELRDPYEAIAQYKAILDHDDSNNDPLALEQLDKIFEREKAWPDLVDIIDRRAGIAGSPEAQADLLYRAARVVDKEMSEAGQAVERYRYLLHEKNPRHQLAREALDVLARDEDTLEAAAEALEPIYYADGLHDKVADLYERRLASRGTDASRRRDHVAALAKVHEQGRRDPMAAFQAWARYLKDEPDDAGAQQEIERIAHEHSRWPDLAALYESILDGMMDAELGRTFAMKLATIYEEAIVIWIVRRRATTRRSTSTATTCRRSPPSTASTSGRGSGWSWATCSSARRRSRSPTMSRPRSCSGSATCASGPSATPAAPSTRTARCSTGCRGTRRRAARSSACSRTSTSARRSSASSSRSTTTRGITRGSSICTSTS